jgi:ligand-binding sensor protein
MSAKRVHPRERIRLRQSVESRYKAVKRCTMTRRTGGEEVGRTLKRSGSAVVLATIQQSSRGEKIKVWPGDG